jgi:hypothetical protein
MSSFNLNLTYGGNLCKNIIPSTFPILRPYIYSALQNYNPKFKVEIVTLYGYNFRDYSILSFGNNILPFIFISSTILYFYIPNTIPSGNYNITLQNDTNISNTISIYI